MSTISGGGSDFVIGRLAYRCGNSARPGLYGVGAVFCSRGATFALSGGLFIRHAIFDSTVNYKPGAFLTLDAHAIARFKPTACPDLSEQMSAAV
jgi:hypothetical protein